VLEVLLEYNGAEYAAEDELEVKEELLTEDELATWDELVTGGGEYAAEDE
jgi:hypothetical protein